MKSTILAATPLLAGLAWTLALVVDSEPWDGVSAVLIGTGVLATATVSIVGMIVTGGRWAHRSALVGLGLTMVIATVRPIDVWWVIGLSTTATALSAMFAPVVTYSIRKLPAATGPSPRAVAPALMLLGTPAMIGFVANDASSWAVLLVGLSAPLFGFAYSRVLPGGLVGVRIVWPVLALGLTPWLGLLTGLVSGGIALGIAIISWGRSVKASFHPPLESGSMFPIPPELAPSEILEAARIDDQGRPV